MNMHYHEGHELQIDTDTNPADHVPAESFVQESAEYSGSGEYFGDFSGADTEPGADFPAHAPSPLG